MSDPNPGTLETILAVDDDAAVLKTESAIPENANLRVLSANSPPDALRIAAETDARIDMPHMKSPTPNILLVDDDRQVVKYLADALEKEGYLVTATTSGKEALALLRERRPDLLILDLNMPEMDGFDLLKIERSENPYLRILVISGYLKGPTLTAAKFVGATATLPKPIRSETLINKVREMLA